MNYRPEYDAKVIGANLKRLREAKSLSVKDVQEYLRLGSVQAIYKHESGKGYSQHFSVKEGKIVLYYG